MSAMTRRPDQGSSTPAPTPTSRRAETSRLRRATQLVLVSGTVLAVAAAFGPLWLVRVGVVVAVAAGVLACALAWRELFWERRQHARAVLRASREHRAAMTEERTRNAIVVDTLTERVQSAGMVIAGQRVSIGQLRSEVSSLHGERTRLLGEVQQRDGVIIALRTTVQAREAELDALLHAADDAEVHHMPRRVLTEHESSWGDLPAAGELWSDGSHPAVVDLKTVDPRTLDDAQAPGARGLDARTVATAMVLPNYEDDRQVG